MSEKIEVKRGRGRPRLSEEEKKLRAKMRQTGELKTVKRPDAADRTLGYVEEGDNTKYVRHMMSVMQMPRIDIADPKQVQNRINEYFELCTVNDMKPTVKGFCNAIGIAKQTLWSWKTGARRADTHEEIILRAYDGLEALWEDYMMNGKINPMAGVFLGVNNYGYKDVKQVNLTPVVQNEPETIDLVALEEKYKDLPDD